jgi:murein DD-endopeptidase MepM/ murein hydrolase activator NlpD
VGCPGVIALAWEGDYPITQLFGVPAPLYTRLGLAGHNGIDVGLPAGTAVRCVESGNVIEVGDDPLGYGYYVKLRSDTGHDWLWAHLSLSALPWVGARLLPGETVAYSGNSGLSTGPHLHLGFRYAPGVRGWPFNGYSDPLPHIGADREVAPP